uniref:Uncharacterized protein n=1 Tax=Tanacetum cinerariifolium TaxID=118510 RepID=A0A6L2JDB6_TANCI|nr:hypothetical protein [Tanacetum cinerariifolium]
MVGNISCFFNIPNTSTIGIYIDTPLTPTPTPTTLLLPHPHLLPCTRDHPLPRPRTPCLSKLLSLVTVVQRRSYRAKWETAADNKIVRGIKFGLSLPHIRSTTIPTTNTEPLHQHHRISTTIEHLHHRTSPPPNSTPPPKFPPPYLFYAFMIGRNWWSVSLFRSLMPDLSGTSQILNEVQGNVVYKTETSEVHHDRQCRRCHYDFPTSDNTIIYHGGGRRLMVPPVFSSGSHRLVVAVAIRSLMIFKLWSLRK